MKKITESTDRTGEFKASPAYSTYLGILDDWKNTVADMGHDTRQAMLLVKYNPDMKKIGAGSSRTAFAFESDPRYVLKLAHSDAGVQQNKTEIKNSEGGDYDCTVRILAHDDTDEFIVQDRCAECGFADWKRITGITLDRFVSIVRYVIETKTPLREFVGLCEEHADDAVPPMFEKREATDQAYSKAEMPAILNVCRQMLAAYDGKPSAFKWKALADVIRFYLDKGEKSMLIGEIAWLDQWGVLKGKTPADDALVIIDAGVGEDTIATITAD